jgi:restriction endonuclease S subunit
VQYGISERANTESLGARMIRMNNLQANGWDFSDLKHIQLDDEKLQKYKLEPGDLLFNRTNSKELVGKCEVFQESGDWVFASYLIRVRLDTSRVIPGYVSDFLNCPAGRIQIDQVSRQIVGMSNVNAEELKDLLVPLPPLQKQRQLALELAQARKHRDECLAEEERIPSELDDQIMAHLGIAKPNYPSLQIFAVTTGELRGSRFDPTFHHPKYHAALRAIESGKEPHVKLGELLLDISGGATPKAGAEELYASSGIKFFRILNIRANHLDFKDLNFINPEVHEGLLKRSQLASGDVVMTITGRVGSSAVISHTELPANINQHIVRLRVNPSQCLPHFLAAYLNTSIGMLMSNRPVSGGTRVALDYGSIREIPVVLPNLNTQQKVIQLVAANMNRAATLRAQSENVWREARAKFEKQLLNKATP